jgi:YNFM family putative membrane transporter
MSSQAILTPADRVPPLLPIRRGTAAYARISLALFLAGFSTFSLLYCVQPLLPAFTHTFAITPAESSLALSYTTGLLAIAIFTMGAVSQLFARRQLMFASMAVAAGLNIVAGLTTNWPLLLVFRALEGIALGGVPAVAMAYLAEEIDPAHLGRTMGLYVGGTAFGGMMGRVGMGLLTEFGSWREAMIVVGVLDLAAAIGFFLLLPQSRQFVPDRRLVLGHHIGSWIAHLRNPALARLFAIGFILTGIFVGLFNYATFRLSGAPYHLSQTAISLIFLTYIFGMFASSAGGNLSDRFGHRRPLIGGLLLMVMGVGLTLCNGLGWVIGGIALVTIGFFIAHSVTSGWIGRLAGPAKGHASSLYLLFYYMGSSIMGAVAGWFWQHDGWLGVAILTGVLGLTGIALAMSMQTEHGND